MIVLMANPWKHPRTGVLYYRSRVPADLSKELKGREISVTVAGEPAPVRFGEACKVSLRTKSAAEAKSRFAEVQSQLQTFWEASRQGTVHLPHEQVVALAGELYRETVAAHESEPGSSTDWQIVQGQLGDALEYFERDEDGRQVNAKQGEIEVAKLAGTERFLALRGLKLTPASYRQFVEQAGGAVWQAYGLLARKARGDYRPDEEAARFPVWTGIDREPATTEADLLVLFEGWAAEAKPVPATYRGWRPYLEDFIKHAGHADASRYTRSDVVNWKDALVERGDAVKTINDSKLASLKTVLKWAFENERIPVNPAAGVTVRQRKKPGEGMKGFSAEEASMIFAAAEQESSAVYRWVPVICALSGARVAEITQLRGTDVRREYGVHYMAITADAGSVKTEGSERRVPLHPYLIEKGFLDFVRERGEGALFYDGSRRKSDAKKPQAKIVAKNVAAWVHKLGLKVGRQHRKDPNHAWRHYVISQLRDADEVKESVALRLVGHGPKNSNQGYGSAAMATLARAVAAIPVPRVTGEH